MSTDEKKLIENNMGLIYTYFAEHHIFDEDMQQDLMMALCKQIHKYDESRGSISLFIYVVLTSAWYKLYRSQNAKHLIPTCVCVGYDSLISQNNKNAGYTWSEIIPDLHNNIEDTICVLSYKEAIQRYISNCTKQNAVQRKRSVEAFENVLKQEPYNVMVDKYHIQRQTVGRYLKNIRSFLSEEIKNW